MAEKDFQCPNCGAALSNEDLKGIQCPYCGSKIEKVVVQKVEKRDNSYKYDGIVAFYRNEEEAKQSLAWRLANDKEIPIEVFNGLHITLRKVYIPMWHFHVTYKAPWSCQKIIQRTRKYKEDGETKYESWDEYSPANGTVVGNFYMIISGTKEKKEICHDFTKPFPYEPFSPELIDNEATILDNNITRDSAWNSRIVEILVEYRAQALIEQDLPSSYTDLSWHYEYNYNQCSCFLYPVYVATFEYEGVTYENYIRGWGDGVDGLVDAPRQELLDHSDDHDLIEPNTSTSMWVWGLIFMVLGCITIFVSGAQDYMPSFVSAIALCVMGLLFPIIMWCRANNEEELRKRISEDRDKYDHEQRLQHTSDALNFY